MKLTVIGSWGAFPEANEACSGYLLNIQDTNILIDCGSGVLSVLANYIDYRDLDAVILSHYHADHMSDIYSLQYATDILIKLKKRNKPLKIYGYNDNKIFKTLSYKDACIAIPIDENSTLDMYSASFQFLKTNHQKKCFAIKIQEQSKTLVYTADTGWLDGLVAFAKDTDVLLCEASLFNHQKGLNVGHLTAGEAGKIAERSNAKMLALTHFPHEGNILELKEEAAAEYKRNNILMATKGMVINI